MAESLNPTLVAATVLMAPNLCASHHSKEAFLSEIQKFDPATLEPVQSVPGTQSTSDTVPPCDLAKTPLVPSMQVSQFGALALKIAPREDAMRESARFQTRVFLAPTEIRSHVRTATPDNVSQVLGQLKCARAEAPATETPEKACAAGTAPASNWVLSFVAPPSSAALYALHNLHFEHTTQLRAELQRVIRLDDNSEDKRDW